jgi:hypothetical protein
MAGRFKREHFGNRLKDCSLALQAEIMEEEYWEIVLNRKGNRQRLVVECAHGLHSNEIGSGFPR